VILKCIRFFLFLAFFLLSNDSSGKIEAGKRDLTIFHSNEYYVKYPPQILCNQAFAKWEKLEKLEDKCFYYQLSALILKSLISQLKNAPALHILSLESTNLRIDDLETIHTYTPNLEELRLESLELKGENADWQNLNTVSPAVNLQSLYVSFEYWNFNGSVSLTNCLAKWTKYVGQKYLKLVDL
jgi:hypothetical protein